jgi:hypothetical protein
MTNWPKRTRPVVPIAEQDRSLCGVREPMGRAAGVQIDAFLSLTRSPAAEQQPVRDCPNETWAARFRCSGRCWPGRSQWSSDRLILGSARAGSAAARCSQVVKRRRRRTVRGGTMSLPRWGKPRSRLPFWLPRGFRSHLRQGDLNQNASSRCMVARELTSDLFRFGSRQGKRSGRPGPRQPKGPGQNWWAVLDLNQ